MQNGRTEPDSLAPLVARVALGDEESLRALYEATGPLVLGLASGILKEETESEETLVDVFVQVWQQAGRYDPVRGSVVSWIAMLARTRAIDRRRRGLRNHVIALPSEGDRIGRYAPRETAPGPAEVFQGGEDRARMKQALAALPSEQRRAIEAAFYGGLSYSEVARELGEPLGTIKTRIRAGLAALRRNLSALTREIA
ncbi:MAG: sigma-70 family RNA polymerase sigma factor [Planctomycetota bacterium]